MECRGVLRSIEVHKSEIVRDDPLERGKIKGSLEARHSRYVQSLQVAIEQGRVVAGVQENMRNRRGP